MQEKLEKVMNQFSFIASFIERYDKFHGTSPKETTEEPEIMTPEPGMGGDGEMTEAPEISKGSVESVESESHESMESSETDSMTGESSRNK